MDRADIGAGPRWELSGTIEKLALRAVPSRSGGFQAAGALGKAPFLGRSGPGAALYQSGVSIKQNRFYE